MRSRRVVVAMTGASGAVYALKLCEELLRAGVRLTLLITPAGQLVVREECGLDWHGDEAAMSRRLRAHFQAGEGELSYFAENNFMAPIASGSSAPDAMVVCPCSMGTLARVAHGNAGNLLERCADVMIKEWRPLVLVPRETPLSEIHLENMLGLARLGVRMIPPMPAFYHHPRSINDLVGFVVGKVLDALGVAHDLYERWGTAG